MTHYLLLDTMGIQSAIFETNRLRIIAGTSLQLAQWQQECLKGTSPDVTIISSVGGNILATIDASDDAAMKLGREFAKKACEDGVAKGFDVAWALCKKEASDLATWEALQRHIAQYKAGDRPRGDYFAGGGAPKSLSNSGTCRYCGIRPVASARSVDQVSCCDVCWNRDKAADVKPTNSNASTPIECIYQLEQECGATFPDDLEKIVQKRQDSKEDLHDLAVIVIDLNNLGSTGRERVEKNGFEEWARFSKTLETDLTAVYKESLKEILGTPADAGDGQSKILRCRPLFCAGDDAAFALPAPHWPAFIEKVFCKLKAKSLTAAAGVVIAKHNFPLNRLILMAEELVGRAKNRYRWECAKKKDFNDCVVDWHDFQESAFATVSDARNRHYVKETNVATCRPYTADEFSKLIQLSKTFDGDLAERKRFSLYKAILAGPDATRDTLVYEFLRDERPELDKYSSLWSLLDSWKEEKSNGDHALWRKKSVKIGPNATKEILETDIADAIELFWTTSANSN